MGNFQDLIITNRNTLFIRLAILLFILFILSICIFLLPRFTIAAIAEFPIAAVWVNLFVAALYLSLIPFFLSIKAIFVLLKQIDTKEAFSQISIHSLATIRKCAIVISALFIGLIPLVSYIGEVDDAPGLILIGLSLPFVPLIVAVLASVLEKLLISGTIYKEENDLII